MIRAMIFIDGTWLYYSKAALAAGDQDDFNLDYGKLPGLLARHCARRLGLEAVDLVRTHLFGSYAWNYDLEDDEQAQRQKHFFAMLRERHGYDVEVFPIDFKGRRLRRSERDEADEFAPREKCVDMALASSMFWNAISPGSYDVAVVVLGDQDFVPMLHTVRQLGRRVVLASIRESCSPELVDPHHHRRARDPDPIWLDDYAAELELVYETHLRACESPLHQGDPEVQTTYSPAPGERFYCDDCRQAFAEMKNRAQREYMSNGHESSPVQPGQRLEGRIKTLIQDRGFGFIQAEDGQDYFFHLTDLGEGLAFDGLEQGRPVRFEVKKTPAAGKAGAAQNVEPEAIDG